MKKFTRRQRAKVPPLQKEVDEKTKFPSHCTDQNKYMVAF